jgi:hypothetical protein
MNAGRGQGILSNAGTAESEEMNQAGTPNKKLRREPWPYKTQNRNSIINYKFKFSLGGTKYSGISFEIINWKPRITI